MHFIYNNRVVFNILVVQEGVGGGGRIAVERLFKAYKKAFPSSVCSYRVIEPFQETNKRFTFIFRLWHYFHSFRREIKGMVAVSKYDFFLTSDYLLALAFYSLNIKKIKLVFLFHGLRSIVFRKFKDINYRQIIIKLLERLSWVLSDAVIVPSDQAKQFIGLGKAFVVQNIVPDVFFTKPHLNRKSKEFTVLYSGRIVKNKGLENLVKAMIQIKVGISKIKLIIAYPRGGVDKRIFTKLLTIIKNYQAGKYIEFVSSLSEKNLIKYYSNSNVLVLPSELEFAPLSVVESLAAGTPVIGTNVGNIGSLLKKLDSGLILKNNSSAEIANKVIVFNKYKISKIEKLRKKSIEIAESFKAASAVKRFESVLVKQYSKT